MVIYHVLLEVANLAQFLIFTLIRKIIMHFWFYFYNTTVDRTVYHYTSSTTTISTCTLSLNTTIYDCLISINKICGQILQKNPIISTGKLSGDSMIQVLYMNLMIYSISMIINLLQFNPLFRKFLLPTIDGI
jgi:hypothetical protein